jgi:hypothetical protein
MIAGTISPTAISTTIGGTDWTRCGSLDLRIFLIALPLPGSDPPIASLQGRYISIAIRVT